MSTEPSSSEFRPPERLEFLALLGLVPPVSVEDVKQAYLDKAKLAHPDRGGNVEQFKRLQEAFEQATEYARFKASRLQWLTHWVEQYAEQEQVIELVKKLGGSVEVKTSEVMTQSIGPDFAGVLDKVVGIELEGAKIDDAVMHQIAEQRRLLAGLRKLALHDTSVGVTGLLQVRVFQALRDLDLSGTQVDVGALEEVIKELPQLETLVLERTGIGWPSKMKLRLTHRDLSIS